MLFNAAARDMLKQAGEEVDVFANDWWTYLAVATVGGTVIFDPIHRVKYRQHSANKVGATLKLPALLRRTRLDCNVNLRSTFNAQYYGIRADSSSHHAGKSGLFGQGISAESSQPLNASHIFFSTSLQATAVLG